MVQLAFQVLGTYMLVDHSLSRVAKGAMGALVGEGPEAPEIYGKVPGL